MDDAEHLKTELLNCTVNEIIRLSYEKAKQIGTSEIAQYRCQIFITSCNDLNIQLYTPSNNLLKAQVVAIDEGQLQYRPFGLFLLLISIRLDLLANQSAIGVFKHLMNMGVSPLLMEELLNVVFNSERSFTIHRTVLILCQKLFDHAISLRYEHGHLYRMLYKQFKQICQVSRPVSDAQISSMGLYKYLHKELSVDVLITYVDVLGCNGQKIAFRKLTHAQQLEMVRISVRKRGLDKWCADNMRDIADLITPLGDLHLESLDDCLYLYSYMGQSVNLDMLVNDDNVGCVRNVHYCIRQLKQMAAQDWQLIAKITNSLLGSEALAQLRILECTSEKQITYLIQQIQSIMEIWLNNERFTIQIESTDYGKIVNNFAQTIRGGSPLIFNIGNKALDVQLNMIQFNIVQSNGQPRSILKCFRYYNNETQWVDFRVEFLQYHLTYLHYAIRGNISGIKSQKYNNIHKVQDFDQVVQIVLGNICIRGNYDSEQLQSVVAAYNNDNTRSILKTIAHATIIYKFIYKYNGGWSDLEVIDAIDRDLYNTLIPHAQALAEREQIYHEIFKQQKSPTIQKQLLQLLVSFIQTDLQHNITSFNDLAAFKVFGWLQFSPETINFVEQLLVHSFLQVNGYITYKLGQSQVTERQRQLIEMFASWNTKINETQNSKDRVSTDDILDRIMLCAVYQYVLKCLQQRSSQKYQAQIINQIIAYIILLNDCGLIHDQVPLLIKIVDEFDQRKIHKMLIQYVIHQIWLSMASYDGGERLTKKANDIVAERPQDVCIDDVDKEFSSLLSKNDIQQVTEHLLSLQPSRKQSGSIQDDNAQDSGIKSIIIILISYFNDLQQTGQMDLLHYIYDTSNIFVQKKLNKTFQEVKRLVEQVTKTQKWNKYQMQQIQTFGQINNQQIDFQKPVLQETYDGSSFLDKIIRYFDKNKYHSFYCFSSLYLIQKLRSEPREKPLLFTNYISKHCLNILNDYNNLSLTQIDQVKEPKVQSITQLLYYMLDEIVGIGEFKARYEIIFMIVQQLNEHLYADEILAEICIIHVVDQFSNEQVTAYFQTLIQHILRLKYKRYIAGTSRKYKILDRITEYNHNYLQKIFSIIEKSTFLDCKKVIGLNQALKYDPKKADQLVDNQVYTYYLFAVGAQQYQIANQIIQQLHQFYSKHLDDTRIENAGLMQQLDSDVYYSQLMAYKISPQSYNGQLTNMMNMINSLVIRVKGQDFFEFIQQTNAQREVGTAVAQQVSIALNQEEVNYLILKNILNTALIQRFIGVQHDGGTVKRFFTKIQGLCDHSRHNTMYTVSQFSSIFEKQILYYDLETETNKVRFISLAVYFFMFCVKVFHKQRQLDHDQTDRADQINLLLQAWKYCAQVLNKNVPSEKGYIEERSPIIAICLMDEPTDNDTVKTVRMFTEMIDELSQFQSLQILQQVFDQYSMMFQNNQYLRRRLGQQNTSILMQLIIKSLPCKYHLDYYLRRLGFYFDKQIVNGSKQTVLVHNQFNESNKELLQLIYAQINNHIQYLFKQNPQQSINLEDLYTRYKDYSVRFTEMAHHLITMKKHYKSEHDQVCIPTMDFINMIRAPDLTKEQYQEQVIMYATRNIEFQKEYNTLDRPKLFKTHSSTRFIVKHDAQSDQQVVNYFNELNKLDLGQITKFQFKPYSVSFIGYDSRAKKAFYLIEFIKNVQDLKQKMDKLVKPLKIQQRPISIPFANEVYEAKIKQLCKLSFSDFEFNSFKLQENFNRNLKVIDSIACQIVLCYILRLGDRHNNNIVLDQSTDELHFIDFDCVFGKGLILPTTELVCARMTPYIMYLMQIKQWETRVRQVAQALLREIIRNINLYITNFGRSKSKDKHSTFCNKVYHHILDTLQATDWWRKFEIFLDGQMDSYRLAFMYSGWNGFDDDDLVLLFHPR